MFARAQESYCVRSTKTLYRPGVVFFGVTFEKIFLVRVHSKADVENLLTFLDVAVIHHEQVAGWNQQYTTPVQSFLCRIPTLRAWHGMFF